MSVNKKETFFLCYSKAQYEAYIYIDLDILNDIIDIYHMPKKIYMVKYLFSYGLHFLHILLSRIDHSIKLWLGISFYFGYLLFFVASMSFKKRLHSEWITESVGS